MGGHGLRGPASLLDLRPPPDADQGRHHPGRAEHAARPRRDHRAARPPGARSSPWHGRRRRPLRGSKPRRAELMKRADVDELAATAEGFMACNEPGPWPDVLDACEYIRHLEAENTKQALQIV